MTDLAPAAGSELAARIRAVALEEFAARGYGVSLQQIAQKSGCTKANVLYHFGSKEELARAVLAPTLQASRELEQRLEREPGFEAALAATTLMLENRHAVRMLIFHHHSLPPTCQADQLLGVIERVATKLAPSDPTAPQRCIIGFIGVAYVLSIDPANADEHDFAGFDSPESIAQLIRQLTQAPTS